MILVKARQQCRRAIDNGQLIIDIKPACDRFASARICSSENRKAASSSHPFLPSSLSILNYQFGT
jgi:hypothetical protein